MLARFGGLLGDRKGNVAICFALSLFPLMGLVGAALDYGRAIEFREFSRTRSDFAALAIASANAGNVAPQMIEAIRAAITEKYGAANVSNLALTGRWLDSANYSLKIEASLKAFILPAVPFMPTDLPSSVETVVNRIPPTYKTEAPRLSQLSPEAADYNRIYMYCYNPKRKTDADRGRRGMTAIADNGAPGLDYSGNTLPTCTAGEYISYKLRNVRNVRAERSKWDARNQEVYEYYTDTTIDPNTKVQTNSLTGARVYDDGSTAAVDTVRYPMLETILCNTEQQCKSRDQGGILPNNHSTGRTPATATGACTEGKFMYFGWEDRPGGDTDYDDIRLVVACPKLVQVTNKQVKIIK